MSLAKISLCIVILCVVYRTIDAGKLKIFQPKNELQKQSAFLIHLLKIIIRLTIPFKVKKFC